MGLIPFRVITNDIVLDRWSALIQGGRGHAQEVYQNTVAFLQEAEVPGLRVRSQTLATSFEKGLLGNRLEYLAVSAAGVNKLEVYLEVYDVGASLSVHWYLCTRVGIWQTVLEKAPCIFAAKEPPRTLTPNLDLFAKDISARAFGSTTHSALAQAVERLMERLGEARPGWTAAAPVSKESNKEVSTWRPTGPPSEDPCSVLSAVGPPLPATTLGRRAKA